MEKKHYYIPTLFINLCVRPSTNAFDVASPFSGIPTFYDFVISELFKEE